MIQFTRLRLSGFKSFVDPAELLIEPGLTGVVGPNGCGKSNLIEALRWVMGESSARQMRGTEMDDVIFGGTAHRPARSVAEVVVGLDNSARTVAVRYDRDEIEISRRIDRGAGSSYRINGQEARARDVQLLFADAATGARASGLVSQGRVGALINAKPADRRALLEEAAGISGLYSRRHEAELRLKSAETNLERLDDVLATLAEQLKALQRQARQAARYRLLSDQIRCAEAQVLWLDWCDALAEIDRARALYARTEGAVAAATQAAAAAAAVQAERAAILPTRRAAQAEAARLMQALGLDRERLEAEAGRLAETRRDLDARRTQAAHDVKREQERAADAAQALERLRAEAQQIDLDSEGEAEARAEAEARVEVAADIVAAGEQDLATLMEEVAGVDAGRGAALRRVQDAETRRERQAERVAQIRRQREQAEAEAVDRAALTGLEMELEAALEFLDEAGEQAEAAEAERQQAQTGRERARDALSTATAALARLTAEADGLRQLVAQGSATTHRPVLDEIHAAEGLEPALAAGLGDDLGAALDPDAPAHWRDLGPLPAAPTLPQAAQPLARLVGAPAALSRNLAQIGLVEGAEQGAAQQVALAPGQSLVSRDGDLWRWDGFVRRAGAPSPMALRLAQRTRLRELDARLDDAALGVEEASEAAEAAEAQAERTAQTERAARDALRRAEADLARARESHARLAQRHAAWESRVAGLAEQQTAAALEAAEAEAEAEEARAALTALPDTAAGREALAGLRATLAERRAALVEARSTLDRRIREAGDRLRRRDSLRADIESWTGRAAATARMVAELDERCAALTAEIERLDRLPDHLDQRRAELFERTAEAEQAERACADALAAAERAQAEADHAARAAEQTLASARETRIRQEAAVSSADHACRAIAARIDERLGVTPEQARALAGDLETAAAEPAERQRRLDRLTRERDQMGPVNLCAEQEAAELDARLATMHADKEDLVAAIARLRRGISDLNREGREKLLASFQAVDRHFRDLFVKLFGGGRAHLALTETDDPLEAGLEIMASPPGKRLQQMSLLSGGEQALTALALLFAVFMTNPAPICVLDEVDAPLDDANVDRFCSLVEGIAQATRTRFLIVTHHRMTMARMDRLYGVTMAERGLSQLVSVDLAQAADMVEPLG